MVAPGFHRCVFVLAHVFLALISSHESTRESPLVPPDDMCNNTTTNSVCTAVHTHVYGFGFFRTPVIGLFGQERISSSCSPVISFL